MNLPRSKKSHTVGFTLIELLIVIAIIGVLSAVLIAVINPTKQQARAKDAGLSSALTKIGLAIETNYAAYGNVPTITALVADLNNTVSVSPSTNANGTTYGWFGISGVSVNPNFSSGRFLYYDYVSGGCIIARANDTLDNRDYYVFRRGSSTKRCRVTHTNNSAYYACYASQGNVAYGTCN